MQQIHANSDVQALKKVLRAILISDNRNGMPMYLLERAYRDREGTRIPLFGYPNTRMLLAKLDDTVTTVRASLNNVFNKILNSHRTTGSTRKSIDSVPSGHGRHAAYCRLCGWTASTTVNSLMYSFVNAISIQWKWPNAHLHLELFAWIALNYLYAERITRPPIMNRLIAPCCTCADGHLLHI